jgi:glycine/D-amino acid oxidase-like deaminating enzyme
MTSAGNRRRHDVVVVGARVAGSATAMLLARLGQDVAVVDQASFPSDTMSTSSRRGGTRWTPSSRPPPSGPAPTCAPASP